MGCINAFDANQLLDETKFSDIFALASDDGVRVSSIADWKLGKAIFKLDENRGFSDKSFEAINDARSSFSSPEIT